MSKLDEIKAFIQKNVEVMAELAESAQYTFFSPLVSDEIIEKQQDLRRHARRIGIINVEKPFFEEADLAVLIKFSEFSSFINLDECKVKTHSKDDVTHYHYSIIIDNIVLNAVKDVLNEEHKKAQAI